MIVRRAGAADAAALAELQDVRPADLTAFADWMRVRAGTALLTAIPAEARARDLSHVTVHSGRRAVGFYLRNGFIQHRQLLLWEPPPAT
ncbi:GNAT family N-acetyltransferase [Actinoplanes sp. NPDC023714]|uniref:GNAT family N-acetyltransferase n=1 Tax=Actinoplanes sp. NPDC023714 TaxID=3154322 RepID=UPI0033D20BD6